MKQNVEKKLLYDCISNKNNIHCNCEKIYEKAYQTFLSKLLNDHTNSISEKMVPIKLVRSINVVK